MIVILEKIIFFNFIYLLNSSIRIQAINQKFLLSTGILDIEIYNYDSLSDRYELFGDSKNEINEQK